MAPHTCPGSAPAEVRRGQGAALDLPLRTSTPDPRAHFQGAEATARPVTPRGTPSISSGGFVARRKANKRLAEALGVPGTGLPKLGTQTGCGAPWPWETPPPPGGSGSAAQLVHTLSTGADTAFWRVGVSPAA